MFDNIGGKIKTLAKVTCWIGIIASIVAAIVLWIIGRSYLVGIGFAVLVLGILFSWVGSFYAYGFGELIETNQELAEQGRTKGKSTKKNNKENNEQKNDGTAEEIKTEDDAQLIKIACPKCGRRLEFEKESIESMDDIVCPYCCHRFSKKGSNQR